MTDLIPNDQNFNILRLGCLMQDRDAQDLKRTILSIIFEILYENGNQELTATELFQKTNEKFHSTIDKDVFDSLLSKSSSFDLTTTGESNLVKLSASKYNEIDKSINEFSIDQHILRFLNLRREPPDKKDKIIEILFQSIYENIYSFRPDNIKSLIPQNLDGKLEQKDLDLFNDFLDFDDGEKDRCLYNHFVKAVEFAILTSGKGVNKVSKGAFSNKCYLLDTNIIFRLIGVGGEERRKTIKDLIESCVTQGISFEYSPETFQELTKKLEQSVIDINRAEKSQKLEIIEDVFAKNPNFFNDDFVTQYCRLRLAKQVTSPEQYELEMKKNFRALVKELDVKQATVKIQDYEKNGLAMSLRKRRSELFKYYPYSMTSARVDASNILHVRKQRGANNYNYADVKAFYLTTDRGLNKILSEEKDVIVPETILPSQLFLIHNPLNNNKTTEPDYRTFFRFLKRRTSEFKLRGKDVFNFITQARIFTTNNEAIVELVAAYSDQRYKQTFKDTLDEGMLVTFQNFSQTYFDKKNADLIAVQSSYNEIKQRADEEISRAIQRATKLTRWADIFIALVIIPAIAIILKLYTSLSVYTIIILVIIAELIKFFISSRTTLLTRFRKSIFIFFIKRSNYYKLSGDHEFFNQAIELIDKRPENIWR